MDTMLLAVTVASLLVAAASTTVAWQVMRAERQRRTARVAALVSAAGLTTGTPRPETPVPSGLHEFIPAHDEAQAQTRDVSGGLEDAPVAVGGLFGKPSATSGSAGRQQWLMGAAGVFAALVITVAGIVFLGNRTAATVSSPAGIPLELVALNHSRAEGGLAVAGLVRNPAAGAPVAQLDAEVRVFDAAGILIATRLASIDASSLEPGQETAFAVTLGELATAARYRVSFNAAGTMRPHVDLRTNQPAAVTAEAR